VSPDAELAGARDATARMRALVDRTPDLTGPSLLPGWTRAHVVAHVAGNARGLERMLRGALGAVPGEMYPGGEQGRARDIERLAQDPAAAVAEVHRSADDLEDAWQRTTDWAAKVQPLRGGPVPVAALAYMRWREVEVHAVDLGAGYTAQDWPQPFLDRFLVELRGRRDLPPLDGVSGPDAAMAAWLSGRSDGAGLTGPLPDLPQWI
jgi:maleylpyruvate isomerase